MGDINIDSYNCNHSGHYKLKDFCDIYDLSNLIKGNTCFMNKHKSSIDIILTNKPKSFQHTVTFETGLSHYHHMISTGLKTHLIRLKPKVITYRCYKKFNQNDFLAVIENAEFNCNLENADDSYKFVDQGLFLEMWGGWMLSSDVAGVLQEATFYPLLNAAVLYTRGEATVGTTTKIT